MTAVGGASDDRRFRLLVVDDEPENVEFLRRMFRRDYEVEVALSGQSALAKLEQQPYDVIITDQMMPGMTGTELLTRSLTLAPGAVRILVTGFPDLESAIASINEGKAYRFFTKPIDRKELSSAVCEALSDVRDDGELRRRHTELSHTHAGLQRSYQQLEASIDGQVAERAGSMVQEVARLRQLSPYDLQSGLYSRRAMQVRLEEEVARSERYGLVCVFSLLRITNYAQLADPAGAVERVSSLLRLTLRRFDCAARWSDNCFAMMMPHVGERGSQAATARMCDALRARPTTEDGPEALEVVWSTAMFPQAGCTAEELVAFAETALINAT